MTEPTDRLTRAIAAIDAANAEDPTRIAVDGVTRPKEVAHAEMVPAWVQRLRPDASDALPLAARGHHFRRWTVPRASYPEGRAGYLRWRRDQQRRQADELGALLAAAGYDPATVARVQAIVRKEGLGTDPDVQVLEDAVCLVFLQTQLADVALRLDPEKLASVLGKTAAKMSPEGRSLARTLALPPTAGSVFA